MEIGKHMLLVMTISITILACNFGMKKGKLTLQGLLPLLT